jgi:hypothetical protein
MKQYLFMAFAVLVLWGGGVSFSYAAQCFGDGMDCDTSMQTLTSGQISQKFTSGSDQYIVTVGSTINTSRWDTTHTCLGNGSTCGTAVQSLSLPGGATPYVVDVYDGGTVYLIVTGKTGFTTYKTYLYKWMSGSSCFGNGTTCGTAMGNAQASIGNPVSGTSFMSGSNLYTVVSYVAYPDDPAYPDGTSTSTVYKWMSGSSCFGNGSTCNTPLQSIVSITDSRDGGLLAYTVGGQQYLVVSEYNDLSAHFFTWQSAQECFGDGTTCGSDSQTLSFDDFTGIQDWEVFSIGSTAYLAGAAYQDPAPLYQWMSGSKCWGDGTTCGAMYQGIPSSAYVWKAYTANGSTFLVNGFIFGANVFAWQPTDHCFGDGTSCGEALQSFDRYVINLQAFEVGTTTYLATADYANRETHTYQWTDTTPTCSVSVTPNAVDTGSSATLTWTSTNADSFYIDTVGFVNATGTTSVAPTETTDYAGTVFDADGNMVSCTGESTLTVYPTCTFGGTEVVHGSSVTAYQAASVPNGSSCVSETRTCTHGSLSGSYLYDSCTVITDPPTGSISVTPPIVRIGGTATVAWSSEDADTCAVTGGPDSWSGTSGSETTSVIHGEVTYTLSCTNMGGDMEPETATVRVESRLQEI